MWESEISYTDTLLTKKGNETQYIEKEKLLKKEEVVRMLKNKTKQRRMNLS
jgi:hypothetical protein